MGLITWLFFAFAFDLTWSKAKKLPGNPFKKKLYFSSTQAGGGGVPLDLLLCTELLLDAA